MKPIKDVNLLAGSTAEAPAGLESFPVMKDGNEPPDMLLALLNNALPSMVNSQQARIMGTCQTHKGIATIILFYGTVPTAENLLALAVEAS